LAAIPSIERARPGPGSAPEVEATRDLYERYADRILGYCLHQLGSREEAEDATQSTFLNAFRSLRRGVRPELEAAWLFKIAHNVCLSRRRSSWRRRRVESPADLQLVEEVVPAPPRTDDDLIGLEEVLVRLPETQRRAILLREWKGLSYREIAEELGVSQPAVETLLFRARRSLAAGLQERPRRTAIARRSSSVGSFLAPLKGFLFGGTAAKVATAVVVVAASSVATVPLTHHSHEPAAPSIPSPAVAHIPVSQAPSAVVPDRPVLRRAVTPARTHGHQARPVARHTVVHVRHRPPAATRPAAPHVARSAPPVATAPHTAPAATSAASPHDGSTPPGQAKRADAGKPTPPGQAKAKQADSTAAPPGQTEIPPGQAKKSDSTAPPPGQAKTPPGQAKTPPGQAKKADPAAAPPGQTRTPPGQAKKDVADAAAPPATPVQPATVETLPPGQAKTADVAPPPPVAEPPAADPPAVAPPAANPPADTSQPAVAPPPPADPGNNGNGNAYGHDKDH
jgi:RNA polymerase sigma factor (sigma-70 family)